MSGGVRLRELDDSRRGARFSNRKEDKLLERKLSYLTNQVIIFYTIFYNSTYRDLLNIGC